MEAPANARAVVGILEAPVSDKVVVVVLAVQASDRVAEVNAADSGGTTNRMTASPRKCFASTVLPRWLRAVDGLGSAPW